MEVNVTATSTPNVFNVTVEQGGSGGQGPKGDPGESAYQVAVDNGFVGTESEWLASLKGDPGEKGDKGAPGDDGADGTNGESAYQIWLDNGNTGSEQDFLDSLVGPAGTTDYNDLQNKPTLGTAAAADVSAFATAAQGALADTAVQPGDLPSAPTWTTISGKPAFVAEGANAAAARTALGLGTAATTASTAYATAAQGTLANTAVQPAAIANMVESQQEGGVGTLITNIIQVTQAEYDGLTPQAGTFYAIVG